MGADSPKGKPVITQCEPFNYRIWNREFLVDKKLEGLRFLHVGKCGGTSIMKAFLEKGILVEEYHLRKPPTRSSTYYFMWVRNPYKRFVSAFNHSKSIVEYDIDNVDISNLSIDNSPAPAKIISKVKHGYAISPDYDKTVSLFESANALAESLTSSNKKLRSSAFSLMQSRYEHIYKGIGWYCDNGQWIHFNKAKLL